MAKENLQELMDLIAKEWECNEERYKKISGLEGQDRQMFLVHHAQMHFDEHKGKIAAICGSYDHNGTISNEERSRLDVLALRMLITSLYLANELDIDAKHIFMVAPSLVTVARAPE